MLKAWRTANALSQKQAAERAEMSQSIWSDYENGRKQPGIDQAMRIEVVTTDPATGVVAIPLASWAEDNAATGTEG